MLLKSNRVRGTAPFTSSRHIIKNILVTLHDSCSHLHCCVTTVRLCQGSSVRVVLIYKELESDGYIINRML